MQVSIVPMTSEEEAKGKAFVHCTAWKEAYHGLLGQGFLDARTLGFSEEKKDAASRRHTRKVEHVDTPGAIRNEFMRIYARERLDRITVKGLCAAVPVARTTFYAYYRNVDDVLAEAEDSLLAGLAEIAERVSGGDLPAMDFGEFLGETLVYIRANWDHFHALLVDQPDMRFVARWKDAVKANFARRYPEARMRGNWDLLAEMGASAVIGAYTWWMAHPEATGAEEAKRQVERALDAIVASL